MTLYPTGYQPARVSLDELQRRHSAGMEPEYARRLFAWIASKDGQVGVGSAWRPTPIAISQASLQGKSFQQTQSFADGTKWFCAVDLVVPTSTTHSSGAGPVTLVPPEPLTPSKDT